MQPHELERLCEIIIPGQGPPQIDELSRGLVNQSLRVARDGRIFSLRVPVADGGLIALDRAWESQLLRVAGAAQLAPELLFSDPARGVLLSEWLRGPSWAGRPMVSETDIEQIAQLLHQVHALTVPLPVHRMSPADWAAHYDARVAASSSKHRSQAAERLREWAALAAAPQVVCHGDLHALNLVQSEGGLRLLDWEYAHVSEAFWDLAGWCANGDFSVEAKHRLLTAYLGHAPTSGQWRRLELLGWLYDYICLQWSGLYLSGAGTDRVPAGLADRASLLDARLSLPAN